MFKNCYGQSGPEIIWLAGTPTATYPQLMALSEGFWQKVLFPAIVTPKDQAAVRYNRSLMKYGPEGIRPSYQALVGFGSAQIMVRALNQADPEPDARKLIKALYDLSGHQTILPPLTYTPQTHRAPKGYYLGAVDKKGHFVRVWPQGNDSGRKTPAKN